MSEHDPYALVVPDDPHYTPERQARREAANQAFLARIAPFVREVIGPVVEARLREPLSEDDPEVKDMLHGVAVLEACGQTVPGLEAVEQRALTKMCDAHLMDGKPLEEAFAKKVEETEERMRDAVAQGPTPERVAAHVSEAVENASYGILCHWPLDVLELAGEGGKTVPVSRLDDCSMPVGHDKEGYDTIGWQYGVTFDHVRDILRRLRASLPPGEVLPPEVLEIFATYDVTLSP